MKFWVKIETLQAFDDDLDGKITTWTLNRKNIHQAIAYVSQYISTKWLSEEQEKIVSIDTIVLGGKEAHMVFLDGETEYFWVKIYEKGESK